MSDFHAEILVLAANPGGLCAAISAARSGRSVVVLESTSLVGGMNGNGVCGFDAARPAALSGLALEFESLVADYYSQLGKEDDPVQESRSDQAWEPAVNRACWQKLIDRTENLTVITSAVVVDAMVEGDRITEVHWLPAKDVFGTPDIEHGPPNSVKARIVVDASYEGDILAFADVPHCIGREPRSWSEPHAGRVYSSDMTTSPDGFMPHSILPGSSGEGDDGVSAFGVRVPCKWYDDASEDAPHRVKSPPSDYDPSEFKWKPQGVDAAGNPVWFKGNYLMVGGKYLLNRMVQGNELSKAAYQYIVAHPKDRPVYRDTIMNYTWSYLYFIQTEGGTPNLGPADDDFPENGGVPYQVYVRAGRRIEGQAVVTEADITPYISGDGYRPPVRRDSIAVGDWILESHACVDRLDDGYNFPEGWLFGRVTQCPYQLPYGCLIPNKVSNLLVCGSVSATHIGYSATRCESVRMQTGIAAGLAAAICVEKECAPAAVPVSRLQEDIVAKRGQLIYFGDVDPDHPRFKEIQWAGLHGYVPQDDEWFFEPDSVVSWSELVRTVVTVLDLPISVTGEHFEGIGRRHPDFRYVEAIYDLGTRSGVDIFGFRSLGHEDPLLAILRLYPAVRLIPFQPDRKVARSAAIDFFSALKDALFDSGQAEPNATMSAGEGLLTRAELSAVLFAFGQRTDYRRHEALARPPISG